MTCSSTFSHPQSFCQERQFEPGHDKTNKMRVRPAKTQISLGSRPVWSESSLSAWRILGPLATHWAHSKDSDQIGRMPRLIWVFAGRTLILLVLSSRGSFVLKWKKVSFSSLQRFFLLSRHRLVKNWQQCSKLQWVSHRIAFTECF